MNPLDDPKYQIGPVRSPADAPPGAIISSDTCRTQRIPPGQSQTRKWPVLHFADVPDVDLSTWTLQVGGLVATPLTYTWEQYRALPRVRVFADFHCVTRWSRLGNVWEGVSVHELARRAGLQPQAQYVIATGYDYGWTTNLPLSDFLAPDALIADQHDGEPIDADHGGPARLMVPLLYAWKSAKWIKRIDFVAHDQPGYWERAGYHNHGDPWTEERFG
ncbi:MAG: sulfite oxidase-like oxidoreductase [Planctomycetota bacterium]|nr:MAG: sulfite oxidase-like oxidoreductase [Planctomycetota bacterium]